MWICAMSYVSISWCPDKAGNTTMNSVTIPAQNEDDAVCGLYNMSLEQPTYIKMDRNSVFYFYGYAPEAAPQPSMAKKLPSMARFLRPASANRGRNTCGGFDSGCQW